MMIKDLKVGDMYYSGSMVILITQVNPPKGIVISSKPHNYAEGMEFNLNPSYETFQKSILNINCKIEKSVI